ncbi:hypothetical protein [Peribacillus tepidiphilus]|nr:hypothetical protein [Peribacillus tepidiphilus]
MWRARISDGISKYRSSGAKYRLSFGYIGQNQKNIGYSPKNEKTFKK